MTQQRIFITGGASGLGKAIATFFAGQNWRVCIGDINAEVGESTLVELRQIHADVCYINCDVRNVADIERVRDQLVTMWGGLDVVVNNAGVAGSAGAIEEIPIDDWDWVLGINLLGTIKAYQIFAPLLKKQNSGHIVNIASAAGLMNAPRMANYNASKAAVISISETTRLELAPFNVGVSVACPGFFPSNLADSIRSGNSATQQWIEKAMDHSGVSAEDVAALIYDAILNKKFWVLPHKVEKRLWLLKRWMPEVFFRQMSKRTLNLFAKS